MIVFIIIHFISSTLYATDTFVKEQQHVHVHYHIHENSNHKHKHVHAKINSSSMIDFFINLNQTEFTIFYSKENYLEETFLIINPAQQSIFRPPIV